MPGVVLTASGEDHGLTTYFLPLDAPPAGDDPSAAPPPLAGLPLPGSSWVLPMLVDDPEPAWPRVDDESSRPGCDPLRLLRQALNSAENFL